MEERWTSLRGERLRLLTEGGGDRTVLLWPGLGLTAESLGRLLRGGAQRGYRMAGLDAPGHGRSGRIPLTGWRSAADVVEAALDALGARIAVIGGHSYGAAASLAALAGSEALRDRVRGLALYDGGYLPVRESREERHRLCEEQLRDFTFATWEEYLAAERKEAPRWDEVAEAAARAAMCERQGRIALRVDPDSCKEAMDLVAASAPSRLPRLYVRPALLVRAGRPAETEEEREAGASALRAKVPALEVAVLPDAAHAILDEDPEGALRETLELLSRVDWR